MRVHGLRSPWVPNICSLATSVRYAVSILIAATACVGAAFAQNTGSTDGHGIFMQNGCFVCHGQDGNGGAGPRFRGDPFLGITDYVIAQILLGRGIMPSYASRLNDQQLAAVATYIRSSWGNNFGEVKPEQVAQVRKQIQQEENQMGSSQPSQGPANPPPATK